MADPTIGIGGMRVAAGNALQERDARDRNTGGAMKSCNGRARRCALPRRRVTVHSAVALEYTRKDGNGAKQHGVSP